MALSGTLTSNQYSGSGGKRGIQLNWTATQNIANNTSTISWSLTSNGTTSSGYWYQSGNFKVVIDGSTVYSSATRINLYQGVTIASGTKTITHNADGTRSFSAHIEAGIYTVAVNCTGDGSWTLDTIPRATQPTVSASSVAMNSAVTISTPRASSSFTHTLTYAFGGTSGTIASGVGTSYSWTVPLSLANQVPNSTSGTCTITCNTYNGSTLIGTKTVTFTATVPSSVVPSISTITCTDPTGNASKYGAYVQNKSTVKVVVSASGSYSSSISAYKIVANGTTYTSNSPTTGALSASGTNTITVTVTDSRGRTATNSTTISVLAYSTPTISYLTTGRCNSSGVADENGEYISASFRSIVTALNNKNHASAVLQYKKSTDSTWVTAATYTNYDQSPSMVFAAATDSSYNVKVTITDDFSSGTYAKDVATVFTLMDFNASGKGMAIGKVSESDIFEVDMQTVINNGKLTRNSGGGWISGRDNAVVRQTKQTATEGYSWNPVASIKTGVGNWTIGNAGGERLVFSYDTDANYNKGTNSSTPYYIGTDGTFTGKIAWGNVTGKPSTYAPSSHTHDDRYYTESEINTKINWNNHMKSNYTSWGTTVTINTGKKDGIGICFADLTQATVFRVSGSTLALSTKDLYKASARFSGATYNSSTGVVTFTCSSAASMAIFFISGGTY